MSLIDGFLSRKFRVMPPNIALQAKASWPDLDGASRRSACHCGMCRDFRRCGTATLCVYQTAPTEVAELLPAICWGPLMTYDEKSAFRVTHFF
jgi:hypothetical protein